jgi:hypothetical protein
LGKGKTGIMNRVGLYILSVFILLPFFISGQQNPDWLEITPSTTDIDGHANGAMVKPGDTILLLPGQKPFLSVRFLHGTKQKPIVIINTQGLVTITGYYFGIKIDSCSHLKISGRGVPAINYGIKVYDVNGTGVSVEGLSSDFEMEGLEISKTALAGIFAKSDPDCSFNSTRDKYTMRNVSIHDNYIHHSGMEGMYIGNTSYTGKTINCNGKDTLVYPHLLKNVAIYNNRVEHTGWDGIQVSSADSGCTIRDNYIQNDSDSSYWNQMSGILAGGGSRCDCFNNVVKDGKGDGIEIFTLGNQKIFNNLIVNAGRSYHPDSLLAYQKHGIFIGTDTTVPGSSYLVVFNTIISPKNEGIKFNNLPSRNNNIINNLIINPGAFVYAGENAYIDVAHPSMDVNVENNFKSMDYQKARFVDAAQWNFDLQRTSPAVNAAITTPTLELFYDILGRTRPFDSLNDIGAYECHDSSLIGIMTMDNHESGFELIGPNPFNDHLTIAWRVNAVTHVKLSLQNIHGFPVRLIKNETQESGSYHVSIKTDDLPGGFYLCVLETPAQIKIKKLILLR